MIAEIAKGDRWKQANFHKRHYEGFFGAEVGTQKRVRLRSVDAYGHLTPEEPTRPSVQVRSQNYRFELGAAAGKTYPSKGRAVAVFLRIRKRTFVYALCLPGDAGYDEIKAYLDSQAPLSREMRQFQREVADVEQLSVVQRLVKASVDAFDDIEDPTT